MVSGTATRRSQLPFFFRWSLRAQMMVTHHRISGSCQLVKCGQDLVNRGDHPERAELIIHSSMVLKCPENGGCFCVNASRWTSRQEHWEVPRTGFHSAIFPRPGQKCMKCACKKMLLGVSQVELIPSPFLFSPSLYLYIYRWQACGQQGISVQTTRAMPLDYAARSVSQRQDLKNVFLQRVCCLSLHQVL